MPPHATPIYGRAGGRGETLFPETRRRPASEGPNRGKGSISEQGNPNSSPGKPGENRLRAFGPGAGGRPIIPRIDGLDSLQGIFPVRNLPEARKVREWINKDRQIIVLGGGLVGVKTAAYLRVSGFQISLVEKEDHLLPQALKGHAARVVEDHLQRIGIRLFLGQTLKYVEGENGFLKAVNLDGQGDPLRGAARRRWFSSQCSFPGKLRPSGRGQTSGISCLADPRRQNLRRGGRDNHFDFRREEAHPLDLAAGGLSGEVGRRESVPAQPRCPQGFDPYQLDEPAGSIPRDAGSPG